MATKVGAHDLASAMAAAVAAAIAASAAEGGTLACEIDGVQGNVQNTLFTQRDGMAHSQPRPPSFGTRHATATSCTSAAADQADVQMQAAHPSCMDSPLAWGR